jgi:hypothetical protein
MGNSESSSATRRDHGREHQGDGSLQPHALVLDSLRSAKTSDEFTAVFDTVFEEHEQQLQDQRTKYKNLKSEHDKIKKTNSRLRDERDNLREQRDHLRELCDGLQERKDTIKRDNNYTGIRYRYLVDKVIIPYAKSKGLEWNEQTGETIDVVVDPLVADAVEASSLRGQVRALQKELLATVEKGGAIPDQQFAQEFRNLAALIKTLSRTVRLGPQTNVLELLGPGILLDKVAKHHWDGRARTKCLIEAWTWSILLHMVFANPFAFLGRGVEDVRKIWSCMFSKEAPVDWPAPSVVSETWRCTTMEQLVGVIADPKIITQQMTKERYNMGELGVVEGRDAVVETIEHGIASISTAVDVLEVRNIVNKAFALAMQLSFQRARFQVTYPKLGAKFNKWSMVPIPDLNGEDINDGVVAFVVNPGLTKWGDAHGKNLDQRYDMVPSLVQLEVSPEKEAE